MVSSNVLSLIDEGTRSMLFSQLKPAALILTTAVILSGVALREKQTTAHPPPDQDRPSTKAQAVTKPGARDTLSARRKRLMISAPRELKAAAGRGKALVYAFDENDDRIPERPEDRDSPSRK
jgi:hypothetical protein